MQGEESISGLVIRPFREADNGQLIELGRSIGVPARVKLGVDRAPVFSAFSEMQSRTWDTLVAEHYGKIVGFLDMSHRKFRVGAAVRSVTYVGLAGVHPGWRGMVVFPRLLKASKELARRSGSELAIALVNVKNTRVSKLLGHIYEDSIRCENLRVLCILIGPRYRRKRGVRIETATQEDVPAIMDLIARYYGRHQIAPILDRDFFTDMFDSRFLDFLVVRDDKKKVVATMGLWDQSLFRRIMVLGYDTPTLWLKRLINVSRCFTRMARMPDPGGHFNYLYSVFAAFEEGHEDSFCGILRHACNKYRGHLYNFLLVAAPGSSGITKLCRGLWTVSNDNVPVVIPLTNEVANILGEFKSHSLYLEYALS